jgi:hypothetical protein
MPNDRKRSDDLDDITGRRDQIISPRDPQSGLPTGVRATEATDFTSATDKTFGDIEVENDETHLDERSDGPRHVRGVVQKRVPGTDAADDANAFVAPGDVAGMKIADGSDYEEITFAVAEGDDAAGFTYQKIESVTGEAASLSGDEHEVEYDL